MFVHLSIHTPRAGREADLTASMHRFGAAAEGAPGFLGAHTLRDEATGRLIGLAMWESRDVWESGVARMQTAVEGDPFDEWEAEETTVFHLTEA